MSASANKAWLRRVRSQARAAEAIDVYHRKTLRSRVRFCRTVGRMLAELGVDPAQCESLRLGDAAASELAAIPDSVELQRADNEFEPVDPHAVDEAHARLIVELAPLVRRYRDGAEADFAKAGPFELYAWCLHRLEPELWGAVPAAEDELAAGRLPQQLAFDALPAEARR